MLETNIAMLIASLLLFVVGIKLGEEKAKGEKAKGEKEDE